MAPVDQYFQMGWKLNPPAIPCLGQEIQRYMNVYIYDIVMNQAHPKTVAVNFAKWFETWSSVFGGVFCSFVCIDYRFSGGEKLRVQLASDLIEPLFAFSFWNLPSPWGTSRESKFDDLIHWKLPTPSRTSRDADAQELVNESAWADSPEMFFFNDSSGA